MLFIVYCDDIKNIIIINENKIEIKNVILINENFNNSTNFIVKLSKNLTILRRNNLSTIQFDNHNKIILNFNKLNLIFVLLFRDVNNEVLNNSKNMKIWILK